jgi:pilus assembly protein Flp/PilA
LTGAILNIADMAAGGNEMIQVFVAFIKDESGQDLIEYALVVAMIALGATASISSLAGSFSTAFSSVGSKLSTYSS